MKRLHRSLLPNLSQLAIFATMAVLAAAVVNRGAVPQDLMLAMLAVPMFLIAAVMGLRRSPQWTNSDSADATSPASTSSDLEDAA
jgi:hypothetical protein